MECEMWRMVQFVTRFEQEQTTTKLNMIRVHRFLQQGKTEDIFIDVKVPEAGFDIACVYIINYISTKPIIIDNLKVWSFDE
jgi:hypothetical protein